LHGKEDANSNLCKLLLLRSQNCIAMDKADLSQADMSALTRAPNDDEMAVVVARCRQWHLDLTNSAGLSEEQTTRPEPGTSGAKMALLEHSAPPGYHQGFDVSAPGRHVGRPPTTAAAAADAAAGGDAAAMATTTHGLVAPAEDSGAWAAAATSPLRSVATTALMLLYLSGDTVHIFSVATTLAALALHGGALLETPSRFRAMATRMRTPPGVGAAARICLYALIHAGLCAVGVAVAVYKCAQLGLLPSDLGVWEEALLSPAAESHEPVFGGLSFR
jgi:hypothetical protein